MADNWSPSTVRIVEPLPIGSVTQPTTTLSWTFTIPDDATRDQLNNLSSGAFHDLEVRGGYLDPVVGTVNMGVTCNDDVWPWMSNTGTGGTGNVDNRFQIVHNRFLVGGSGFGSGELPGGIGGPTHSLPADGPWVTGTNTIRYTYGAGLGSSTTTFDLSFDFDCMFLNAGGLLTFPNGSKQLADAPPAGFASHVNGTPLSGQPADHKTWIFKAPDATVSTTVDMTMTLIKRCLTSPGLYTIGIHVEETLTGNPGSGSVTWSAAPAGTRIALRQNLDSAGNVYFANVNTGAFGFGGNATQRAAVIASSQIGYGAVNLNCGGVGGGGGSGWHVGYVGMGTAAVAETSPSATLVPFRDSMYGLGFGPSSANRLSYVYQVVEDANQPTGYKVIVPGPFYDLYVDSSGVFVPRISLNATTIIGEQGTSQVQGPYGLRVVRRSGNTLSVSGLQHSLGNSGSGINTGNFMVRTSDTTFARGVDAPTGGVVQMCSVSGSTISVDSTTTFPDPSLVIPVGQHPFQLRGYSGGYLHAWRNDGSASPVYAMTFTQGGGISSVDYVLSIDAGIDFANLGAGQYVLEGSGSEMIFVNQAVGAAQPVYYDGSDWIPGPHATLAEFPLGIRGPAEGQNTPRSATWPPATADDWMHVEPFTVSLNVVGVRYSRTSQSGNNLTLTTPVTNTAIVVPTEGGFAFGSRVRQSADLVVIQMAVNPPGPALGTGSYLYAFDAP